jgi:hypothetical protein
MLYVFLHTRRGDPVVPMASSDDILLFVHGALGSNRPKLLLCKENTMAKIGHLLTSGSSSMSTQLIGFSMGGVAKRFLVSPPSMSACLLTSLITARMMMGSSITVWPANLVTCALFNTLHSQVYSGFRDTGMSRERFSFMGFWHLSCGVTCASVHLFHLRLNLS